MNCTSTILLIDIGAGHKRRSVVLQLLNIWKLIGLVGSVNAGARGSGYILVLVFLFICPAMSAHWSYYRSPFIPQLLFSQTINILTSKSSPLIIFSICRLRIRLVKKCDFLSGENWSALQTKYFWNPKLVNHLNSAISLWPAVRTGKCVESLQ